MQRDYETAPVQTLTTQDRPVSSMPMPPQLSQQQRESITASLFRREDAKEIAEANGISERQVRRIAQNLKQYGTVTAPRLKKMGRPTCLNKEIEVDLRQFVSAQPLALLEDMQAHIQEKFNVKCSRASLSRRMREMGFTRGIIRRGFRSSDQSIPPLSDVDIQRLMADPSPDEELVGVTGNAKKAKYAWLLNGEPAGVRKPRKKRSQAGEVQGEEDVQVDPMLQDGVQAGREIGSQPQMDGQNDHMNGEHDMQSQYPMPVGQQYLPAPLQHGGYDSSYISPYRSVTADRGMMVQNPDQDSSLAAGGAMNGPRQMALMRESM